MKCNRCIHYNVCLGYRNIDYDGDSNSCPYAKERLQGEWISVKERLPDKNGRYLVTNYNLVCLRRFSVARNEFGYFDNTDESYESRWVSVPQVTAWMPLPEPYKEAENGR